MKKIQAYARKALRWCGWRLGRLSPREWVALAILMVPVGAGIVLSFFNPPANTTLAVARLTPKEEIVVRSPGVGTEQLWAKPRILTLRGEPPKNPADVKPQRREVEVRLPIGRAACRRLREKIGGACGDDGAAPRTTQALTVEWPTAADVSIGSDDLQGFWASETQIYRDPDAIPSWDVQADSPETEVDFECAEEARFRVVVAGKPLWTRCTMGPQRMTFKLALSGRQVPTISMTGLEAWGSTTQGERAEVPVAQGNLFVGSAESELQKERRPVEVSAGTPRGVELDIEDLGTGSSTAINAVALPADRVEVEDEEKLPTRLDRFSNWWFLFLGLVGGVFLSVFLERVPDQKDPTKPAD